MGKRDRDRSETPQSAPMGPVSFKSPVARQQPTTRTQPASRATPAARPAPARAQPTTRPTSPRPSQSQAPASSIMSPGEGGGYGKTAPYRGSPNHPGHVLTPPPVTTRPVAPMPTTPTPIAPAPIVPGRTPTRLQPMGLRLNMPDTRHAQTKPAPDTRPEKAQAHTTKESSPSKRVREDILCGRPDDNRPKGGGGGRGFIPWEKKC